MRIHSSVGSISSHLFIHLITCEVLLDYPKIGGDDVIEDYEKKAIRNPLHANIYVHSRILIADFSKDGIKCIEIF